MRWATRAHCHIDRVACAWLIRRFIDYEGEFVFVDDPDDVPTDATPFDMRGVELGHHDGDCSFEAFLRRYELADPVLWELARIVRQCQELPGQELFQYVDEEGRQHDVTSGDVNAYLREVSGEDFTAKDFRTWAGTVLAAKALAEIARFKSNAEAKRQKP